MRTAMLIGGAAPNLDLMALTKPKNEGASGEG